jgi:hypothetical protein
LKCQWHLCTNEARNKFCSRKCNVKFNVDKRRKKLKSMAVDYKGGECEKCGYKKCITALEFHHLDPSQKDFGISVDGNTRGWVAVKTELDKCILVCANCHREIHEELNLKL